MAEPTVTRHPRAFVLNRTTDVSGVSGTGVVAEGVEFADGTVALRWTSDWPTSVVFHDRGIASVEAIHGHSGATRIVYLDDESHVTQAISEVFALRDEVRRLQEGLSGDPVFTEHDGPTGTVTMTWPDDTRDCALVTREVLTQLVDEMNELRRLRRATAGDVEEAVEWGVRTANGADHLLQHGDQAFADDVLQSWGPIALSWPCAVIRRDVTTIRGPWQALAATTEPSGARGGEPTSEGATPA